MSRFDGLRRSIVIRFHWVVALFGLLAIVFSPFVAVGTSVPSGVTLLVVGLVAVAVSIQLARSLDIQRRVRKLAVTPAPPPPAPAQKRPGAVPRKRPVITAPPGAGVTPGRLLSGHGAQHLPVIAFDLTGLAESDLETAVDSIAVHQLITGSFKPVFIIDRPEFGPMRTYGYLAELLIAPEEWQGDPSDWRTYVRRRLESILKDYACADLVRVGADGLGEIGRVVIDRTASDWRTKHQAALSPTALPQAAVRSPRVPTPDAAPTL